VQRRGRFRRRQGWRRAHRSTKEQKKRVEELGEAVDEKREDMKRRRRRLNAIDTEGETVKDGDDT